MVWVGIGELKPNPRNSRTHSKRQIKALGASVKSFGWTKPIVTDGNGMIVAGHGLFAAAKLLGFAKVPIIRRADLSREQVRLYSIADNKLAQLSGWDSELLAIELKELEELKLDISLTGFEPMEIENLLDDLYPRSDPEDDIPTTAANGPTVCRVGELFLLGKHRVLCGDATCREDVELVLGGAKPQLLVSDPPYGTEYNPAWRMSAGLKSTSRSRGIRNDDRADWYEAWVLFPGNVAYVWHSALRMVEVYQSLVRAGFEVRSQVIWSKNRFAIGRGDYHWAHEPAFYAVRKGCSSNWRGNRQQSTVWQIAAVAGNEATDHPTQKPVECMKRPILNNTSIGDGVYDAFLGAGTTLVACERTARIAYGIELDPHFVDTAIHRWQAITGKDAFLADTTKTFDELAAERIGGGSRKR